MRVESDLTQEIAEIEAGYEGARPKRRRGKLDPTRMQGALVISDDTKVAIENCELFQDINRQQLMEVAALVEELAFEPEEFLIKEMEAATHIYVVVEGHAAAQLKLDHGWLSLGIVSAGEAAGWTALMEGRIYPASVKALTPMKVARLESKGLNLLMNLDPKIGYPIHKRLSSIFYRQYENALRAIKTAG